MLKQIALVVVAVCIWSGAALGGPFDQAYWIAVSSGVVKIEVSRSSGYALGTGVTVAHGRVATACHVLRGGRRIAVLHAGMRYGAAAPDTSSEDDVCILQVPLLEAPPAMLRLTSRLSIGEEVGAIGFSAGAGVHYARGAVHRLHPYRNGRVIQGSAAFTSGASGGGLFDAEKRLVGILLFRMRGPGPQYFSAPVEWIADGLRGPAADLADAENPGEPFWNRPPDQLPYFMRANLLISEQRWDDLQALLPQWLLDEPSSAEPAFLAGELDSRHGQMQRALADYREAVRLDPAHALAWSGLVRASLSVHDVDVARQAYERLVPLSVILSNRIADEFPEVRQ
jgi:serine protease Do